MPTVPARLGRYRLEGRVPVEELDTVRWAQWLEGARDALVVAREEVRPGITVSTVFVGLDFNFGREGPPLLFETMQFGGEGARRFSRSSTWEQAEQVHADLCAQLRQADSSSTTPSPARRLSV